MVIKLNNTQPVTLYLNLVIFRGDMFCKFETHFSYLFVNILFSNFNCMDYETQFPFWEMYN